MLAKENFKSNKQYFASLPVSVLNVDNTYQKPLSMAHVNKIAKDFDRAGVGQIHVSLRNDGTYWVFDGQHRVATYRKLGIKHIDAIVYEGMTLADESKGYVYYNNTMKQTQLQKFKAELLAGVPEAIEIYNIAKSLGLGVDIEGERREPIKAVGALKDIYYKNGANDLRETLEVLESAFGRNKSAYQAFIVKGVHKLITDYKKNPKFDKDWLINRYKKFGVAELINQTNTFNSVHGSNKKDAVGLASIKLYNYNKSKENKL